MYLIKWQSPNYHNIWITGESRYKTINAAFRQVDRFKQVCPKNNYRIESDSEEYSWNRSMAI